jgi:small neutral amino acid transporter SnatA (MarC family)
VIVWLIRGLHNRVAKKYAAVVDRYTDLVGRISALVIGTIAVDMILRGIDLWRKQL